MKQMHMQIRLVPELKVKHQNIKRIRGLSVPNCCRGRGSGHRFVSIYSEYIQAKDVTRQRMFLETMEKVLAKYE